MKNLLKLSAIAILAASAASTFASNKEPYTEQGTNAREMTEQKPIHWISVEQLKKENLLQAVELGNTDSSLLNKQVQHIHHNSKEVSAQTLYICKGLNYKSEYLEEAIHNGAMV